MWAHVRVVEASRFPTDADKQKAVNCAS